MRIFEQRRPQFIRVLAGMQTLGVIGKHLLKLDDACCDMLKQIALSTKVYLPTPPKWEEHHRLPSTLEEAAAGGSGAAWTLLRRKTLVAENQRFERLQKLAATQEAAARESQKLQAVKSQA